MFVFTIIRVFAIITALGGGLVIAVSVLSTKVVNTYLFLLFILLYLVQRYKKHGLKQNTFYPIIQFPRVNNAAATAQISLC